LDQQRQLDVRLEPGGRAGGAVRHQALVREVNVQIVRLQLRNGDPGGRALVGLVCECGDAACLARIDVTPAAFDAARLDPTTFLVSLGHELRDGTEIVVAREAACLVVRKRGQAADDAVDAAAEIDVRRDGTH